MKPEHKKLIVAAVLLAVAGGSYWFYGRTKPPLPDSVTYVCVATGETVVFSRNGIPNALPAKNPRTGERTLLPVWKNADGKLLVGRRVAGLLYDPELARVNKYVDPNTLEVLKSPR